MPSPVSVVAFAHEALHVPSRALLAPQKSYSQFVAGSMTVRWWSSAGSGAAVDGIGTPDMTWAAAHDTVKFTLYRGVEDADVYTGKVQAPAAIGNPFTAPATSCRIIVLELASIDAAAEIG